MLSQTMHKSLLGQLQNEWEAQFTYLGMMAWCQNNNFDGFAKWFEKQAAEEYQHGLKILHYVNQQGATVEIPAVPAGKHTYKNLDELFQTGLTHEQNVTRQYYTLMDQAIAEKDHTTQNFLRWFIDEQLEEEDLFRSILAILERVNGAPGGLFMLENKLAARES